MPLFEYECLHCGLKFESLSRAYEPVRCRGCNTIELKKLVSLPAVRLTETQTGYSSNRETDRKGYKRERLTGFYENEGKWKK